MIYTDKTDCEKERLLFVASSHSVMHYPVPVGAEGAKCSVLVEAGFMEISSDIHLVLLYRDGCWQLEGKALREANTTVVTLHNHEKLLLILSVEKQHFQNAGRLCLNRKTAIKIGKDYPNQVYYDCNSLVLPQHVCIDSREGRHYITAKEAVYVNEKLLPGERELCTGDRIDLYGLHMIFLGDWLICIAYCGVCRVEQEEQKFSFTSEYRTEEPKEVCDLIERNYGQEKPFRNDELEILPPQEAATRQDNKLFLTLGPSLTMPLPIICMAMLGAGAQIPGRGNFYMLTAGMTICTGFLAVFWGMMNHFYRKHMEKATERNRRKQYREYLEQTEVFMEKCMKQNSCALEQQYPPADKLLSMQDRKATVLWNRFYLHQNFLFLRIGSGDKDFQMKLKFSAGKRIVREDLMTEAEELVKRFSLQKNAPVGIDFHSVRQLGMVEGNMDGDAHNILKLILLQTAACHCYTDLKLVCFYSKKYHLHRDIAGLMKWLPHSWSAGRRMRYLAGNESEAAEILPVISGEIEHGKMSGEKKRQIPWYLVFVLDKTLVQGEDLYKYLTDSSGVYPVSTIWLDKSRGELPRSCRSLVQRGIMGEKIITRGDSQIEELQFSMDRISAADTECYVRQISGLRVKDEEAQEHIPDCVDFLQLYSCKRLHELDINQRWMHSRPEERLKVPIGKGSGEKTIYLDLHEKFHGPHGLIAGTTGAGKSELLQTYLLSVAVNFSPQDVNFFMIDYKGGGTGNLLKNLPHCAGVISNLSGNQIKRAMSAISSENKRRQKLLSHFHVNHIDAYMGLLREGKANEAMPHLILVIDEFAELKKEEPEFMQAIISLAQVGRSLGVHLILATQKPAGTVDDKIWSNARFRLCLRVQDGQDSMDMLHCKEAALLTTPGRCYLQIGNQEMLELFQTAYCGGSYSENDSEVTEVVMLTNTGRRMKPKTSQPETAHQSQLEALTDYIRRTAQLMEYASAKALWMPELPERIYLEDIGAEENVEESNTGKISIDEINSEAERNMRFVIGLCDDPENQQQKPLYYSPLQEGSLAVFGGPATGKSTLLQTILWQLSQKHKYSQVQFLIIDFSRGSLHCFAELPHCRGLLKGYEEQDIFFYHLQNLLTERKKRLAGISCQQYNQQPGEKLSYIFLVVDGYKSFSEHLTEKQSEFMLKLASEGMNYGIMLILSATGTGEIPARIFEKMKSAVALEMSDRYQYGDIFRQYHITITPKENTKGRGLCRYNGAILEFQTAIAFPDDDYRRMCEIQRVGKEMMKHSREGKEVVDRFPSIPDNADYETMYREFEQKSKQGVPIGYSLLTGEMLILEETELKHFLISGSERTGKKNLLAIITNSLKKQGAVIIIIDFDQSFKALYEGKQHWYISKPEEMYAWMHTLDGGNCENEELCIVISDLTRFCTVLYGKDSSEWMTDRWEEWIAGAALPGKVKRCCLLAVYRPSTDYSVSGTVAFRKFSAWQTGIHLGGNAGAQRVLLFDDMSYSKQNQKEKPGIGYLKKGQGEETIRVLLPAPQSLQVLENHGGQK